MTTRKSEVEYIVEALTSLGRFEHDRTLDRQMQEKIDQHRKEPPHDRDPKRDPMRKLGTLP